MARERHSEEKYKKENSSTENFDDFTQREVTAGISALLGQYIEMEKMKKYLLDGAVLKCSKSTLDSFEVKDGPKIILNKAGESQEEQEKREQTRLYVRVEDGKVKDVDSLFATIYDCKKGELSALSEEEEKKWKGPNIYPFRCNCEVDIDRDTEKEIIEEHRTECEVNGVCQYLMDLNDTWETGISDQGEFYEERKDEDGNVIMAECITMKSMLFCKHGGLITPIKAGQVDYVEGYVTRTTLKSVGFIEITDESIRQLNVMLFLYDITSIEEIRHFLSQSVVECAKGEHLEEQKNEDYKGSDYEYFVGKYFYEETKKKRLGNEYERDGYIFRGGGYLQLTGRYNYQKFAEYLEAQGRKDERIMQEGAPIIAQSYAWESATWYWKNHEEKKEEHVLWNGTEWVENDGSVEGVTKFITGGDSGLDRREIAYGKFKWED